MAYVKVDYRKLEKTVSEIKSYISKHKQNMRAIGNDVSKMGSFWAGKDYNRVKNEWSQINASGSTSDKMLKALDNYADFLDFSAQKYKNAQRNAINRANRLPRY